MKRILNTLLAFTLVAIFSCVIADADAKELLAAARTTTTVKRTTTTTVPPIRLSMPISKAIDMGSGYRPIGRGPILSCVNNGFDIVKSRPDGPYFISNGLSPKQTTVLPISKPKNLPYVDGTWTFSLNTGRESQGRYIYDTVLWACLDSGQPFVNQLTGLPFWQKSDGWVSTFSLTGIPICGLVASPCVNAIAITGPQNSVTQLNRLTYPNACSAFTTKNNLPSTWFDEIKYEGYQSDKGAELSVAWEKGANQISGSGKPPCDSRNASYLFRSSCDSFLKKRYSTASKEVWTGTFKDASNIVSSQIAQLTLDTYFPKPSTGIDSNSDLDKVVLGMVKSTTGNRMKMGVVSQVGQSDQLSTFKSNPETILPIAKTKIASAIDADQASNQKFTRILDFASAVPVPASFKIFYSWLITAFQLIVLVSSSYNTILSKQEFYRTIARTIGCQWVHAEVYGSGN